MTIVWVLMFLCGELELDRVSAAAVTVGVAETRNDDDDDDDDAVAQTRKR